MNEMRLRLGSHPKHPVLKGARRRRRRRRWLTVEPFRSDDMRAPAQNLAKTTP
jgi:hypothetical protein